MEGMLSIHGRNTQTEKELGEIKEAIGFMSRKGKEKELGRVESLNARECLIEGQLENLLGEIPNAAAYSCGNSFICYSMLEFPRFSS